MSGAHTPSPDLGEVSETVERPDERSQSPTGDLIDRAEGELALWLSHPLAALDEQAFAALVVGFLDHAAAARERLEAACRDPGAAQASQDVDTLTDMA